MFISWICDLGFITGTFHAGSSDRGHNQPSGRNSPCFMGAAEDSGHSTDQSPARSARRLVEQGPHGPAIGWSWDAWSCRLIDPPTCNNHWQKWRRLKHPGSVSPFFFSLLLIISVYNFVPGAAAAAWWAVGWSLYLLILQVARLRTRGCLSFFFFFFTLHFHGMWIWAISAWSMHSVNSDSCCPRFFFFFFFWADLSEMNECPPPPPRTGLLCGACMEFKASAPPPRRHNAGRRRRRPKDERERGRA